MAEPIAALEIYLNDLFDEKYLLRSPIPTANSLGTKKFLSNLLTT
jgi:hypothetical protein